MHLILNKHFVTHEGFAFFADIEMAPKQIS